MSCQEKDDKFYFIEALSHLFFTISQMFLNQIDYSNKYIIH